jgi:hypothetical protein
MSIVQSVIFNKNLWSIPKARDWIYQHGFTDLYGVDKKVNVHRWRQIPPEDLEDYDYFTKDLNNGVKLVIAYQKKKNDLLDKVKKKLKELKIKYDNVELSPKKDKKIRITIDGRPIDFGSKTSISHLEEPNELKRQNYIKRHSKIFLKDGTRAIDRVGSPSWLSFRILWS